ncbi:ClpXP protease specificity-enhancing factor [Hydrogenophaga sp. BPS33]|uniref:ClpXP protease specificity-enhancing factor n=1 Tax=Hydrogenophaga sp. BPS33 TaxID=2651974 RepID=UPI00131FCB74|nr:ClpXP protease specificity-enhancing factor [Hydrogenophaga sp. BPS33]QHE87958.1 ClpXP protease specificity-enhancing factor [Hydrogenophaga sp. BPS33]
MSAFEQDTPSARPYLIRALHEWCADNGFSPYIAVHVDASVRVPMEFVKNGEIVLNVSMDATNGLRLGNDFIEFKARFGGVAREIVVPVTHVIAIYARENGQGMAFPAPAAQAAGQQAPAGAATSEVAGDEEFAAEGPGRGGASLRAVTSDDTTPEPGDPPELPPGPGRPGGKPQLKRVK